MPSHKQQHFVPRCHLKPFSIDQAGAAINLFNLSRLKHVQNAPLKGQCARHYFYGEDLVLEKLLQEIETRYGSALSKIQGNHQLADAEISDIRTFAYLQYSRTEAAINRRKMAELDMHAAIYDGRDVTPPDIDFTDHRMMLSSLITCVETRKYVDDLKVCIIKNLTRTDFVTSDDPALFVNRFYAQRLNTANFGIAASGAIFFMPLAPRYCLMCYDGNVYTIGDKRGAYVDLSKAKDVFAVNELQYLKASENIYYSQWQDRDRVEAEFLKSAAARPKTLHRSTVWVPAGETAEHKTYRRATEEERRSAQHTMISTSIYHPLPSQWLSKLRYRIKPRTYSNGSAVGHVRKPEWLRRSR